MSYFYRLVSKYLARSRGGPFGERGARAIRYPISNNQSSFPSLPRPASGLCDLSVLLFSQISNSARKRVPQPRGEFRIPNSNLPLPLLRPFRPLREQSGICIRTLRIPPRKRNVPPHRGASAQDRRGQVRGGQVPRMRDEVGLLKRPNRFVRVFWIHHPNRYAGSNHVITRTYFVC